MGIFDFITKTQEATETLTKKLDAFAKQDGNKQLETILKSISNTKNVPNQKRSKVAKKVIEMYYSDYPETPYVSNEREAKWLETARLFPSQCIIPKSMMKRFSDGLLPGHIYMLYWLGKYTNKKIPSYFEYKYGIDFAKEKAFLFEYGYLDNMDKPTCKGENAIKRHLKVVENHKTPKPDISIEGISKQILEARDSMRRNGFTHYEYIANHDACDVCRQLNKKVFPISQLKIGVNAPPMHEGCRCSIAAYSDRKEYEKWLNSL